VKKWLRSATMHPLSDAPYVEQKRDGVIQNAKTACLGVKLNPSIRASGTDESRSKSNIKGDEKNDKNC